MNELICHQEQTNIIFETLELHRASTNSIRETLQIRHCQAKIVQILTKIMRKRIELHETVAEPPEELLNGMRIKIDSIQKTAEHHLDLLEVVAKPTQSHLETRYHNASMRQALADTNIAAIHLNTDVNALRGLGMAQATNRKSFGYLGALSSLNVQELTNAPPATPFRKSLIDLDGSDDSGQKPFLNKTVLISVLEKTNGLEVRPEDFHDNIRTQQILNHLSSFVDAEENPFGARMGLGGTITWFKLNQDNPSQDDGQNPNQHLQSFLRDQVGPAPLSESHELLISERLVSKRNSQGIPPDLEPRIYTSSELADILGYNDGNIRRLASEAWQDGPEPRPLKHFPEWYVVSKGNTDGGRGRGWKFQQLKKADGDCPGHRGGRNAPEL